MIAPVKKILPLLLRLFFKSAAYLRHPVFGPVLKKLTALEPGSHTQGYTLSINAAIPGSAQGVVLPIDMMKRMVQESDSLIIMNTCLCRTASACKTFPHDHGCIFIGGRARGVVQNGLGREVSREEALRHIDRGAELGLIGQALWIEAERFLLGIEKGRDRGTARWLEICFCCPCCCGTFKLVKNSAMPDIARRFRSIGWKAAVDAASCTDCRACMAQCPVQAIERGDHIVIDQNKCLGCGFCAAKCPVKAISLKLQTPLLATVQDYFVQSGLKVEI